MASVIKVVGSDPHLMRLLGETGMLCVGASREDLVNLARSGAQQPAVLVVDLRGASAFPAEVALLKRQHPGTAVLLVVSALDPRLMLEAMRAGVSELIAEPLSEAEVQAAIKRLVGAHAPAIPGDVFAFVGAKGGVGTTTVAVNIASALAKKGSGSALLIDLNAVCGDTSVFLGVEPRFSVVDALANIERLDAAYFSGLVVRSKFGLDLLGASSRPATNALDPDRLRALLEFVRQPYRYSVLDVPRSDAAALEALDAATRIVLVVNQELASVRNGSRMAATLRERYGQARLRLVLTRTDRRAEIGLEDVERTVGIDISHSFPNDYRLALQAMNKGRPIALDSQTELGGAFIAFARELAGDAPVSKHEKARADGLFGRLTPRKA